MNTETNTEPGETIQKSDAGDPNGGALPDAIGAAATDFAVADDVPCSQCGVVNPPDSLFCGQCGIRLTQPISAGAEDTIPPVEMDVPLRLVAAGLTDSGVQRDYNQDDFLISVTQSGRAAQPVPQVFIVADGMGGTTGGEIASALARNLMAEWAMKQSLQALEGGSAEANSTGMMTEMLKKQVKLINSAIYTRAQHDGTDMGTTITGAIVVGNRAYVVNVGDSRTYLIRDGQIRRVSKDHSLVERLVQRGSLRADEVYNHPQRNMILRSLGDETVEPDVFEENLRPNDVLLVCSDGLWEMVRDSRLGEIISSVNTVFEACELLIREANRNGGEDNITAVVVYVAGAGPIPGD